MPVTARNIGPLGRAWRWVRRNEALASVIAVAAVVLITVSAWLIVRWRFQYNDAMFSRQFFESVFIRADPEKATKPIEVVDLLDDAVTRLNEKPPDNDRTEASARELIGSVYRKFDKFPKALENLDKALAIRERHPGDKAELASVLHNLAAMYWWDGRYDKAEPLYVRSLALRRELYKGDHPEVATSLTHLAACRLRQGRGPEAEDLYTQALDMRRRLYKGDHEEVAQALNNLAKVYLEMERYEPAEKLSRQAVDMIIRLKGEKFAGTASALQNLATLLLERGDPAGARDAYQRAFKIRSEFFPAGHHAVATSMTGIAQAELALGNPREAFRLATDARAMYEARNRVRHVEYAECLEVLGEATLELEGPEQAEAVIRKALRVAQDVRPVAALKVAQIKGDLGSILASGGAGRADEAATLLRESLEAIRAERTDRSRLTGEAAARFIAFCDHTGRSAEAEKYRALARTPDTPAPR
jgi:tetratricopeptide (TPR) repeat protein